MVVVGGSVTDVLVVVGCDVVVVLVDGVAVEVVEAMEEVVVDGVGPLLAWKMRPVTRMARPNPPRISHRRGCLGFGSGPPTTEKSYGDGEA